MASEVVGLLDVIGLGCADHRQKVERCCEGGGCPSIAEVQPVGRGGSGRTEGLEEKEAA
jgi:hypothetical protein